MANGDTKTNQYLDIAANGSRADLPGDTCCETRSQTLIRGVANRIMDLEDEVERLENNPDVADIVATYADLQAYDTSQLTDKDIIRVLQDETRDGDSTYYRWSTATDTWTYVGESKQYTDFVGTDGTTAGTAGLVPAPAVTDTDRYLKSDGTWAEVQGGGGGVTTLTQDDYNYDVGNTGNNNTVALWLLPEGIYLTEDTTVNISPSSGALGPIAPLKWKEYSGVSIVGPADLNGKHIVSIHNRKNGSNRLFRTVTHISVNASSGGLLGYWSAIDNNNISDSLTSTEVSMALSAKQGKVLNDHIGDLSTLTTTDKTSAVAAINEIAAGGGGGGGATLLTSADYNYPASNPNGLAPWLLEPGLYYTTYDMVIYDDSGSSSSSTSNAFYVAKDRNGAKAVFRLVNDSWGYKSYTSTGSANVKSVILDNRKIKQTTGQSTNDIMSQNATTSMVYADPSTKKRVQIGNDATADRECIAIGEYAFTMGQNQIAIGRGARVQNANARGCIALGDQTYISSSDNGVMSIGPNTTSYGYNNSNYRLLTGLYDPQTAHDAATKGYVDGLISALEARIAALEGN